MFGNELTEEQRQTSLMNALGIAGVAGAAKVADKMASGTKLIPYSKEFVQNQVQKAQGSIKDMGKAIGKTEVPTGVKVRTVADTTGNTYKHISVDKTSVKDLAQKITTKNDGSKGTGEEYKNYKAVEYNGTTKINGEVRDTSRRVFQRIDIDYKRVDPKTGKTNYQLMKNGRPPIWKDGTKIELHHLIQREPGSMVELPSSMHKEYDRILHGLVENGGSFRNDPVLKKQYENFRSKYWRWRAKQIDKGEL